MNQLKRLFLCLMLSGASLMAATTPPYATSPIQNGRYALQQPGDTNSAVTASEYVAFLNQQGATEASTYEILAPWGSGYHYYDATIMGPQGCITRSGDNGNYVYSVNNGQDNQIITSVSSSYAAKQFQTWRQNPSIADLRDYITAQFQLEYANHYGAPVPDPSNMDISNFNFILSQQYPEYVSQLSDNSDYSDVLAQMKQRYPSYTGAVFNEADKVVGYLLTNLPKCTPSNSISYLAISSPSIRIPNMSLDSMINLTGVSVQTIITIPTFYYGNTITKDPNFSGNKCAHGFNDLNLFPNGAMRPFVIPAEKIAAYYLDQEEQFYRIPSSINAQLGAVNVNWANALPCYTLYDFNHYTGLYNDVYNEQAAWLF